jgi:hypothetical protein
LLQGAIRQGIGALQGMAGAGAAKKRKRKA